MRISIVNNNKLANRQISFNFLCINYHLILYNVAFSVFFNKIKNVYDINLSAYLLFWTVSCRTLIFIDVYRVIILDMLFSFTITCFPWKMLYKNQEHTKNSARLYLWMYFFKYNLTTFFFTKHDDISMHFQLHKNVLSIRNYIENHS